MFYSVGKLIGDKVIYCSYCIYNRLIGADIICHMNPNNFWISYKGRLKRVTNIDGISKIVFDPIGVPEIDVLRLR